MYQHITALAFHETGHAHHHRLLFSVTPNIPAADALRSASELLSAAVRTLDGGRWMIRQLIGRPTRAGQQLAATVRA